MVTVLKKVFVLRGREKWILFLITLCTSCTITNPDQSVISIEQDWFDKYDTAWAIKRTRANYDDYLYLVGLKDNSIFLRVYRQDTNKLNFLSGYDNYGIDSLFRKLLSYDFSCDSITKGVNDYYQAHTVISDYTDSLGQEIVRVEYDYVSSLSYTSPLIILHQKGDKKCRIKIRSIDSLEQAREMSLPLSYLLYTIFSYYYEKGVGISLLIPHG